MMRRNATSCTLEVNAQRGDTLKRTFYHNVIVHNAQRTTTIYYVPLREQM